MPEYSKAQQLRKKPKPKTVNGYKEATEAARDWEGVLHCARCTKPIHDGDEHRHHIKYRSQGGTDEAGNLSILHRDCHEKEHSHRCLDNAQSAATTTEFPSTRR